jgi:hypothetical protein
MHLKLDKMMSKNLNGMTIQIYVTLIVYLILQLLKAPHVYGSKLVNKLRYTKYSRVEFCPLAPSGRSLPQYVKFCCRIQRLCRLATSRIVLPLGMQLQFFAVNLRNV